MDYVHIFFPDFSVFVFYEFSFGFSGFVCVFYLFYNLIFGLYLFLEIFFLLIKINKIDYLKLQAIILVNLVI